MAIDEIGGGKNVVGFESPNSDASEKEIIERRAKSIAVMIENELQSVNLDPKKLAAGKNVWSQYPIGELEQILITMPVDWKRSNSEQWLVIAQILQEKYLERDRN
jgi:hypothetical protein